jgi:hypothetical protein
MTDLVMAGTSQGVTPHSLALRLPKDGNLAWR